MSKRLIGWLVESAELTLDDDIPTGSRECLRNADDCCTDEPTEEYECGTCILPKNLCVAVLKADTDPDVSISNAIMYQGSWQGFGTHFYRPIHLDFVEEPTSGTPNRYWILRYRVIGSVGLTGSPYTTIYMVCDRYTDPENPMLRFFVDRLDFQFGFGFVGGSSSDWIGSCESELLLFRNFVPAQFFSAPYPLFVKIYRCIDYAIEDLFPIAQSPSWGEPFDSTFRPSVYWGNIFPVTGCDCLLTPPIRMDFTGEDWTGSVVTTCGTIEVKFKLETSGRSLLTVKCNGTVVYTGYSDTAYVSLPVWSNVPITGCCTGTIHFAVTYSS